jgi:hypothetical protein
MATTCANVGNPTELATSSSMVESPVRTRIIVSVTGMVVITPIAADQDWLPRRTDPRGLTVSVAFAGGLLQRSRKEGQPARVAVAELNVCVARCPG